MAAKFHVRSGDEVVVIAGSAKGRRGKIKSVLGAKESVVLEGTDERAKGNDEATKRLKEEGATEQDLDRRRLVKPVLHHLRKTQNTPQGGLLWLEGPIHISNVMKAAEYDQRRSKKSS